MPVPARKPFILAALILAATGAGLRATHAASVASPILLELFTSEGCSSCPPADAELTRLAARPDVLALDLHVDYWDGAAWRDPFSKAAFTRRQRDYARTFGQDDVYTPELVVNGETGVVGSDTTAVEAAIRAARPGEAADLRVEPAPHGLRVSVARGAGAGTVWLVGYDPRHETRIGGGENGGRVLVETDIVRSMQKLANWTGQAFEADVPPGPGRYQAVFIQSDDGRILAVRRAPST